MADSFLSIGGITIAIRSDDASMSWDWSRPSQQFLIDPAPADVQIAVERAGSSPSRGELLFDSGGAWRMFRESDGYRIDCTVARFGEAPYRVATFDENFTRGRITIEPSAAEQRVNPLDYPLDELLVAQLLARGRGVELHSCGIIDRNGRGRLFCGSSGAGKSTTARLWGEAAKGVVSDDRVIVREEGGTYWMYGTPWHGEADLSMAARAPLQDVYLLTQAPEDAIRELEPAEAVARLFACTFPVFHDPDALQVTLAALERLVAERPVRELRFTRHADVARLVG